MKEYVGIYIKTKKAWEQDGFGNKIITYIFLYTCSNSSHTTIIIINVIIIKLIHS